MYARTTRGSSALIMLKATVPSSVTPSLDFQVQTKAEARSSLVVQQPRARNKTCIRNYTRTHGVDHSHFPSQAFAQTCLLQQSPPADVREKPTRPLQSQHFQLEERTTCCEARLAAGASAGEGVGRVWGKLLFTPPISNSNVCGWGCSVVHESLHLDAAVLAA